MGENAQLEKWLRDNADVGNKSPQAFPLLREGGGTVDKTGAPIPFAPPAVHDAFLNAYHASDEGRTEDVFLDPKTVAEALKDTPRSFSVLRPETITHFAEKSPTHAISQSGEKASEKSSPRPPIMRLVLRVLLGATAVVGTIGSVYTNLSPSFQNWSEDPNRPKPTLDLTVAGLNEDMQTFRDRLHPENLATEPNVHMATLEPSLSSAAAELNLIITDMVAGRNYLSAIIPYDQQLEAQFLSSPTIESENVTGIEVSVVPATITRLPNGDTSIVTPNLLITYRANIDQFEYYTPNPDFITAQLSNIEPKGLRELLNDITPLLKNYATISREVSDGSHIATVLCLQTATLSTAPSSDENTQTKMTIRTLELFQDADAVAKLLAALSTDTSNGLQAFLAERQGVEFSSPAFLSDLQALASEGKIKLPPGFTPNMFVTLLKHFGAAGENGSLVLRTPEGTLLEAIVSTPVTDSLQVQIETPPSENGSDTLEDLAAARQQINPMKFAPLYEERHLPEDISTETRELMDHLASNDISISIPLTNKEEVTKYIYLDGSDVNKGEFQLTLTNSEVHFNQQDGGSIQIGDNILFAPNAGVAADGRPTYSLWIDGQNLSQTPESIQRATDEAYKILAILQELNGNDAQILLSLTSLDGQPNWVGIADIDTLTKFADLLNRDYGLNFYELVNSSVDSSGKLDRSVFLQKLSEQLDPETFDRLKKAIPQTQDVPTLFLLIKNGIAGIGTGIARPDIEGDAYLVSPLP